MDDKVYAFRHLLKSLRKEKGITQAKLAKAIFVDTATISKLETGRLKPTVETIALLAVYFNVTTDYLLAGEIIKSRKTMEVKYE